MAPFDFSQYRAELSRDGEVTLAIRVRPNAQKTRVVSAMDDGSVKIDLKAPPEDNKANEELIAFLSEQFSVDRRNVAIIGGIATRRKIVRITA